MSSEHDGKDQDDLFSPLPYLLVSGAVVLTMSSTLEIIHKYHIISAQISAWEKPF
ncbi:hypothetical protein [Pseudomonas aeruginosa]|uniref:hypothetical protein n=1 Tax=Pseudomonas aeruginosa TaxID=287 RepID=UPI002B267687|nr:hypothetical protein [Pseudomonas aeruginosa]